MDIHGFHVVSEVSGRPETWDEDHKVLLHDGHVTNVTDAKGTTRGPFDTIKDGIDCAHAWKKENEDKARADLKAVEDAAPILVTPIETASETVGIQIPPTTENPPIVESK